MIIKSFKIKIKKGDNVSKIKSKISFVYKCPTCGNLATFQKSNGICSECWGKNKKKIEMKKAIWKPTWNRRILTFNNMSILEKLKDVLERNNGASQVNLNPSHPEGSFIHFKISSFGSHTLEYIFHYWGLDWKELVKGFSSDIYLTLEELEEKINSNFYYSDEAEDNDDFHLSISLWLNPLPNMMDCAHEFKDRPDWKYKICSKCGLFEMIDGD